MPRLTREPFGVIDVTGLLCGLEVPADLARRRRGTAFSGSDGERKPVVVWSVTRTCNLACLGCYGNSAAEAYPDELSTAQGRALLEDLAQFGVRNVVLAGGEPLVRRDLLDLAEYGSALGLAFTFATNGTLLDLDAARRIRNIRSAYVEISLAGIGPANDVLRGKRRAFERAVQGIRNCKRAGQSVGVRLNLTPQTIADLDALFDFVEAEDIARVGFAHAVAPERNRVGLTPAEMQAALRTIARRVRGCAAAGRPRSIFTVDNTTDGPFYYLMLLAEGRRDLAARAYEALARNAGGRFSSGVGSCAIDPQGNVHPDRYWQAATLGNVKERKFSEIWTGPASDLLAALRDRLVRLRGRCAACRYLELCGGNLRVRALIQTGDAWAPDPACYLSDDQIAKDAEIRLA